RASIRSKAGHSPCKSWSAKSASSSAWAATDNPPAKRPPPSPNWPVRRTTVVRNFKSEIEQQTTLNRQHMSTASAALTPADFASDQDIRWCPGCGDYAILQVMKKVLP